MLWACKVASFELRMTAAEVQNGHTAQERRRMTCTQASHKPGPTSTAEFLFNSSNQGPETRILFQLLRERSRGKRSDGASTGRVLLAMTLRGCGATRQHDVGPGLEDTGTLPLVAAQVVQHMQKTIPIDATGLAQESPLLCPTLHGQLSSSRLRADCVSTMRHAPDHCHGRIYGEKCGRGCNLKSASSFELGTWTAAQKGRVI